MVEPTPSIPPVANSRPLTIALCGGGSGGHIMPILAVSREIKAIRPDCRLIYIGRRGEKLANAITGSSYLDAVYWVSAGKWRRYHGAGWRQLFDLPTLLKNTRDFFLAAWGFGQSFWLLGKQHPDALLVKGGFVGLPVGLAAAIRRIPFVTHDSDAVPGLTNRLIGRWAALHAVGLPKELYARIYPPTRTLYVGVPVSSDFQPVSATDQRAFRQAIGLGQYKQVLMITGGGLGALRLSQSIVHLAPTLLSNHASLAIIDNCGEANESGVAAAYDQLLDPSTRQRVQIRGFLSDLYRYSGAADLVVARAGATTIAELAAQHKAVILVPNPQLTGGHQTRNAEHLAAANAVQLVDEAELTATSGTLLQAIERLLSAADERQRLGQALGRFARPGAARELAEAVLSILPASGQGSKRT